MAWEVFKRDDAVRGRDEAFVSIRSDHFAFSSTPARLAGATAAKHVTIHVDCENRKLGFEFHGQKKPHSFPFLDVQLAVADAFERLVGNFFATDRYSIPKGMVEVIL